MWLRVDSARPQRVSGSARTDSRCALRLRVDSARPQRVSGSARTDSRRDESARNHIASHVKFGDDCANAQPGLSQWTATLTPPWPVRRPRPLLLGVFLTSRCSLHLQNVSWSLSSRYPPESVEFFWAPSNFSLRSVHRSLLTQLSVLLTHSSQSRALLTLRKPPEVAYLEWSIQIFGDGEIWRYFKPPLKIPSWKSRRLIGEW